MNLFYSKTGFPQNTFLVLGLVILFGAFVFGQESDFNSLPVDKSISKQIKGGEKHSYKIQLTAGQFFRAEVEQPEADVVVRLFDSNNKELAVSDFSGQLTTEPLSYEAKDAGVFRLEIAATDESAASGKYNVKIQISDSATDADRQRMKAESLTMEINRLRNTEEKESLEKALQLSEEVLSIWRNLKDKYWEAYALNGIGFTYVTLNDNQKALEYFNEALPVRRMANDQRGEAITLRNIGNAYKILRDYNKAADAYTQAIAIQIAIGNKREAAGLNSELAAIFDAENDMQQSIKYHLQAAEIYKSLNETDNQADELNSVGFAFNYINEFQRAIEYFNQSIEIYKTTGSNDTRLNYQGLGEAYNNLDEFPQAIAAYTKAAELHKAEKDVESQAAAIEKIARINRNQGELKLALEQFKSAEPLRVAENNPQALGNLYSNIGLLYRAMGEGEQAHEYFKKALPFFILDDEGKPIDAAKANEMIENALAKKSAPLIAYKNQKYLTEGLSFEREIKPDAPAHSYSVKLKKGEFLRVEVAQLGVDVVVALFDQKNNKLLEIDSPNGTEGFESLSYEAKTIGAYRIEVKTLGEKEKGKYGLYVEARLSPTNDDKTRILAERAFAAGRILQKKAYEQENQGKMVESIKTFEQAIIKFNEARKYWQNVNDLYGQRLTDESIAYCYYSFDKWLAVPFMREILAFDRIIKNLESEISLLKEAAARTSETWEKNIGIEFAEDLLLITKTTKGFDSPAMLASAYYYNGKAYNGAGRRQKGFDYNLKALEIYKVINDKENQAYILNNIGRGQSGRNPLLSITYFEKAAEAYRLLENYEKEEETIHNAAVFYKIIGQTQKAIDKAHQALQLYTNGKIKDDENYSQAQLLNFIGGCYEELGEYAKALNFYAKALTFIKKDGTDFAAFVESENYRGSGNTYASLGDTRKALDYYEKALPSFLLFADGYREVKLLTDTANSYAKLNNNEKAVKNYEQALKNSRTKNRTFANHSYQEADILSRISRVKLQTGKTREALELLKEAEELNQADIRKNPLISQTYGDVYARLKDNAKAVDYYHQALGVYRGEQNRSGEAVVLSELANLYQSENKPFLAVFYGKQAITKYQELRQNIETLDKQTQQTFLQSVEDVYKKLSEILIAEGRFAEAQNILSLLKEQEYYDYVRRDASEIKKLGEKPELPEKERELIKRYNEIADRVTELGTEFQKLHDKKIKLPEGVPLPGEEQPRYEQLSAQLDDANAAFRLFLTKELVKELGDKGEAKKREIQIDRSLQGDLKEWGEGTVMLYTIAGEKNYRVILTTPTVQVDGKYEIPLADLNKKIFAFRDALSNPCACIDPRPLGKELYDILIKPIEKELIAADAKTLVWSLDGTLRYIPLAALSPDGKTYLVEKYKTAIVTSTTRQNLKTESEKNWRTLGLGVSTAQIVDDPVSADVKIDFGALPAVLTELDKIILEDDESKQDKEGIVSGRKFVDKDFNEKNFSDSLAKTENGKRKYSVVHIASHFRLGSDTANSFLLLGEGKILTLEQISDTPEMTFNGVELVTLSACNTAFGSDLTGKEVDSLATFIELRGAKSVMATLWAVADESTSLLMSEFYRIKNENPNLSKAEAMQIAQQMMIKGIIKSTLGKDKKDRAETYKNEKNKPDAPNFEFDENKPYSHPYFWSPFVLIGNWR